MFAPNYNQMDEYVNMLFMISIFLIAKYLSGCAFAKTNKQMDWFNRFEWILSDMYTILLDSNAIHTETHVLQATHAYKCKRRKQLNTNV